MYFFQVFILLYEYHDVTSSFKDTTAFSYIRNFSLFIMSFPEPSPPPGGGWGGWKPSVLSPLYVLNKEGCKFTAPSCVCAKSVFISLYWDYNEMHIF